MQVDRALLESFAANLRRIRRVRGLTQERLAELTDLTPRYVQRLEHAGADPSLTVFVSLSKALKIRPAILLQAATLPKRTQGRPRTR
jgi:transcriptional regulator with XRE-family HTH domain